MSWQTGARASLSPDESSVTESESDEESASEAELGEQDSALCLYVLVLTVTTVALAPLATRLPALAPPPRNRDGRSVPSLDSGCAGARTGAAARDWAGAWAARRVEDAGG